MVFSYGQGLLLCARMMCGRIKVEIEASDCEFVTGVLGAGSMEDCVGFPLPLICQRSSWKLRGSIFGGRHESHRSESRGDRR